MRARNESGNCAERRLGRFSRVMRGSLREVTGAIVLTVMLSEAAAAQNVVQLKDVVGARGEHVTVTIGASTHENLSLLALRIGFEAHLCAQIESQSLRAVGRVASQPLEGGLGCPAQPQVRIALFDLVGSTVVPVGEGPIVEWSFQVKADAQAGSYSLGLEVAEANNGPVRVQLTSSGAVLRIRDPAGVDCASDCDGHETVTVNEILQAVAIALGSQPVASCSRSDADGNSRVTVDEIVIAVKRALRGCPDAMSHRLTP